MPPRPSATRSAAGGRGRGTAGAGRGATPAAASGQVRRVAAGSRAKGDESGTPRGRKRPLPHRGQEEEEEDEALAQEQSDDAAGGGDGDHDMGVAGGEGDEGSGGDDGDDGDDDDDDDGREKERIPPELLTRILHGFFAREETRITRDANAAVARYVDVFVREAIARAAVERQGGFLEVEDLEKIAPQLLMDL
ncbi:hypothetical protein VTH06DRAFT_965 [Thermothelomyces fergusii]